MLEDVKEKMNVTLTFEQYLQADDNLLACAVQEIDNIGIEDKNTAADDEVEEEEAAVFIPIPKCSESSQCLIKYWYFLSGISDMLESIVGNL